MDHESDEWQANVSGKKGEETECEKLSGILAERERLISDLKSQLAERERLAEERKERLVYLQAEFENFRKYFEREREQIVMLAEEHLMKDLLPTLDDFQCMLKSCQGSQGLEGVRLVFRNLMKVLESHGLEKIDATGKRFDPHYHEVVCTERCNCEDGMVLEEFQTGYMLKKKVLRPAKVKIAERCTIMDSRTEEGE
ncbi:MAG: nucleotide exchange factor GrpE [Methanomicrobiales archaeon]|nr:nucleotide exchange factor GrpE [Methanomicrobiales archaeon]